MARPPAGDLPTDARSRIIYIRLTINDRLLCVAHHYISASGEDLTEPDPKAIYVDDAAFKQARG